MQYIIRRSKSLVTQPEIIRGQIQAKSLHTAARRLRRQFAAGNRLFKGSFTDRVTLKFDRRSCEYDTETA